MDYSPPGSSVHGIFKSQILEWLPFLPPGNLPDPEIESESPALAHEFLTTEPPGKLMNTRVGCHFLLQGIFPIQGSNQHLLCPLQADSLLMSHWGSPNRHRLTDGWTCHYHMWNPVWPYIWEQLYRQCKGYLTFVQKRRWPKKDWHHLQSSYGEGNGTPLQYSCLENPMDGGAWCAAVHGVTEGWTWLSDFTFTFHFHAL